MEAAVELEVAEKRPATVRVIRWERFGWGVDFDYGNGKHDAYPVGAQKAAEAEARRIRIGRPRAITKRRSSTCDGLGRFKRLGGLPLSQFHRISHLRCPSQIKGHRHGEISEEKSKGQNRR